MLLGLAAPAAAAAGGHRIHPVADDEGLETPDRDVIDLADPAAAARLARHAREAQARRLSQDAMDALRQKLDAVADAVDRCEGPDADCADPRRNPALARAAHAARAAGARDSDILLAARGRLPEIGLIETPAPRPVVALSDRALAASGAPETRPAVDAALATGRVTLAFAPRDAAALDGAVAAPTAAINLAAADDPESLEALTRLMTTALEIEAACGFSRTAGDAAWRFGVRQITLALAGVGEAVMAQGLGTSSETGQTWIAGRAALIHATATAASADMAARIRACPDWPDHAEETLAVTTARAEAAAALGVEGEQAATLYGHALKTARKHGLRHALIGLFSDDAELALRLGASLDGAAPHRILIETAEGETAPALSPHAVTAIAALGGDVEAAERHLLGRRTLVEAPGLDHGALRALGFTDVELQAIETALATVQRLEHAFLPVLDAGFLHDVLGVTADDRANPGFDLLAHLGVSDEDRARAAAHAFGHTDLTDWDAARPGCARFSASIRRAWPPPWRRSATCRTSRPSVWTGTRPANRPCAPCPAGPWPARAPSGSWRTRPRLETCWICRRSKRPVARSPRLTPQSASCPNAWWRRWWSGTAPAASCPTAARAISRRRPWAATRSTSTPANTTTANWARSSSTCTRKAPPSAA
ncbi:hypothetical protein [Brevundimonas denitrificans]|uniref:hypothetical protein n=1 Tax=Brevundimonas denitrificans TaxID=1443434 RepID=UPI00223BBD4A|nr:hypothetical protein [Brevundimonas denitrificans]